MTWSDIPRNPPKKTLRQFAAAWLVFFLAWAAVQWLARGRLQSAAVFAAVAVAGGVGGLIWPSMLRWIFVGWMILVFPIGWLISQCMLLVLFYGMFTPMAFLLRLRGRDALGLKPAPERKSFWLPKETPADVRSYFRQY